MAGIVLYNPDLDRLKSNLNALAGQVDTVILYDNGSDNSVREYLEKIEKIKIVWLGNGKNDGIAKALNHIMTASKSCEADWVVTLDQDSILPSNFIFKIAERTISNDTAIICPKVIDKRRIYLDDTLDNESANEKDEYVDRCITSGSCTRVKAWESIGGFDEYLFIDLVDNDFCKRLRVANWKIVRINSVTLDQEFGIIEPHSQKFVSIVKCICSKIPNRNLAANISKISYKKHVVPLRIYYSNRNIIYLNKKLKKYGGIGYDSYNCSHYFVYAIFYNLASIIRSDKKIETLKAVLKGIYDGCKVKVKPIEIEKIF